VPNYKLIFFLVMELYRQILLCRVVSSTNLLFPFLPPPPERATRIQLSSAKTRRDLPERTKRKRDDDRPGKLTRCIEEICGYNLAEHVRMVVYEGCE